MVTPIAMTRITSNVVAAYGYDPDTGTLVIEYATDDVWHYFDVSHSTFAKLKEADSFRIYLRDHIFGKYRAQKQ